MDAFVGRERAAWRTLRGCEATPPNPYDDAFFDALSRRPNFYNTIVIKTPSSLGRHFRDGEGLADLCYVGIATRSQGGVCGTQLLGQSRAYAWLR